MGRMVRKQVYIEPEQEALLKQRARALGVSEAELIRMGIAAMGRTAMGLPGDQRAWADELTPPTRTSRRRPLPCWKNSVGAVSER